MRKILNAELALENSLSRWDHDSGGNNAMPVILLVSLRYLIIGFEKRN